MSPEDILEICERNRKMPILYIEFSYRQIGLSQAWFNQISKKIGNSITVRREILLQRIRGSSDSPYDRDDIEAILDKAKKPIKRVMLNKFFALDIYEEMDPRIPYIVGVDCSTGSNKDANAMTVVNPFDHLKIVAEFECNYVGEPDYCRCIVDLVRNHIPRAILCIERNHVGDAIIKFLLETSIASRIYYDKFKNLHEKSIEKLETTEENLIKRATITMNYGVYTDSKSREAMFSILANRIKNNKDDFVGQKVSRDISKLVKKGTKILAVEPDHDDNVMSYLIALYVFYHGNNLPVFGFDPADVHEHEEKNTGLNRDSYDDYDEDLVTDDVMKFIDVEKKRESGYTKEAAALQRVMRDQIRTQMLARKGLVSGTPYNNTAYRELDENDPFYDIMMDEDDSGDLDPLMIFDEVN